MKRNYLMASLLAIAAAFSGCSEVDEFFDTNPSKTYEATVVASKEKIDGLDTADEGTRAVFYGGNTARYVTLWDKGDVVHVYKQNGTEVGTLLVTDDVNKDAQFKLKAVLSGSLTGSFTEGESLNLYLPSKARDYNPEQHQTGYINDLSSRFSYQKTTVQIDKIEGSKITLKEADMSHLQAYLRFVLTDMEGNRLHPQQLVISADPIEGYTGRIVTSVDENGTEQYGDLIIENAEKDLGEYPAEMFVALLNGTNNTEKVNYHLTVVDADGVVYSGPSTTQVNTTDDRPFQGTPPTGKLTRVWRKLAKVEPTVELGTQMKMVVGTKRTRVPVVKAGETVVPATCTYTSSNYAVASVNASTGEVMALSTGTATITVNIAPYGVSRTYTVTVTESPVEYVDLGLSVNWATMNVGAESETDYGTYFMWGETSGYTNENDYDKKRRAGMTWEDYDYCNGAANTLTKYCWDATYGYNGFTDDLSSLLSEDDAATANLGGNWRMPTMAEAYELIHNTTHERVTDYEGSGIAGVKFISKSDASKFIFVPASGIVAPNVQEGFENRGTLGYLWTKSQKAAEGTGYQDADPLHAFALFVRPVDGNAAGMANGYSRFSMRNVRAVCPKTNITMASQMKILQGTKNTRKPVVTMGSTDVTSLCTFTYSSSNNSVARISPMTGEVTGVTPGTTTITVTSSAPYAASVTYTVTVTAPVLATADNYVDLGLPSGTLWANRNVGAESVSDYGTYFMWGETSGYTNENDYDKKRRAGMMWEDYDYCNGAENTLTKYCWDATYGYSGYIDNLSTLLPEDDAAIQNWGSDWRMPTMAEVYELVRNTTHERVTDYEGSGIAGVKFISKSDASKFIFVPASGIVNANQQEGFDYRGEIGYLWTKSQKAAEGTGYQDADPLHAFGLFVRPLDGNAAGMANGYSRFSMRNVRAVCGGNN